MNVLNIYEALCEWVPKSKIINIRTKNKLMKMYENQFTPEILYDGEYYT